MAKNTRVTIEAESGLQYTLSRNTVTEKVRLGEMVWEVEGRSAKWNVSHRGYFDASGMQGPRIDWNVVTSGYCGPQVLELL